MDIKSQLEEAAQRTGSSSIYQHLPDSSNNILMYHSIGGIGHSNISTDLFRRHLDWLKETYEIVDLPEVLNQNGGKKIALTFDDGYQSFYHSVLPILREFSAPATLFVMGKPLYDDSFVHDDAPVEHRQYLTVEQIRDIADDYYVTIGNHSMSHRNLSKPLSNSTLQKEIVESKQLIESECGVSINRFCYPGNNWSRQAKEIVAASHEYAVEGMGGRKLVTSDVDPHLIPRVDGAVPLSALRFEVSDTAKYFRKAATTILSSA